MVNKLKGRSYNFCMTFMYSDSTMELVHFDSRLIKPMNEYKDLFSPLFIGYLKHFYVK